MTHRDKSRTSTHRCSWRRGTAWWPPGPSRRRSPLRSSWWSGATLWPDQSLWSLGFSRSGRPAPPAPEWGLRKGRRWKGQRGGSKRTKNSLCWKMTVWQQHRNTTDTLKKLLLCLWDMRMLSDSRSNYREGKSWNTDSRESSRSHESLEYKSCYMTTKCFLN